jgi:hypothetical protein
VRARLVAVLLSLSQRPPGIVQMVSVAFRGTAPLTDPDCPNERTDVNCDDYTTVQDVVKVVDIALRGADPATEFCEPCGM